jgi:isocitrate lyase
VDRLRGTVQVEHTLARLGAERLWELMTSRSHVQALGAMTGNQAIEMVEAGLDAIYVSGWQVAGDANSAGQVYPDQSLYPSDSVPQLCRRINNALLRADQIWHQEGKNGKHWLAPLVADAEAGFGGTLNAFELMKGMIECGAAAVHFEDQLSSAKKCGHMCRRFSLPAPTPTAQSSSPVTLTRLTKSSSPESRAPARASIASRADWTRPLHVALLTLPMPT